MTVGGRGFDVMIQEQMQARVADFRIASNNCAVTGLSSSSCNRTTAKGTECNRVSAVFTGKEIQSGNYLITSCGHLS
jgi:hypothetical protein